MATQLRPSELPSAKYQPLPAQTPAPATASPLPEVNRRFNTLALTGVTFGLISCFYQALGVTPILGIVFSTLGLVSFDDRTEKMRWMAVFGLGLSILVTMLSFR